MRALPLLICLTLAAILPAPEGRAAEAHYLEARDAAGGLEIAEAGVHHLWLWGPERKRVGITLPDGRQLGGMTIRKREGGYVWHQAGELTLPAGTFRPVLGEHTAALALSRDADFQPESLHSDTRARLDPREAWPDTRATAQRHTDTVFTMPHYADAAAWAETAAGLRDRILLSSGLWAIRERTPLNARVFDWVERDGYSVAKVHFEAWPGYLVTGNLYRPAGDGPFAGVIHPHGHWEKGRLEDSERGSVAARCITLARMGAVSFTYDMVGYNDSRQLGHTWGGAEEKLWGLHPFAIQLWSALRALDFLESLPEVDAARLGCTGASGGGTQTFAAMAVDARIKVAAPVNMISSTMQGGCVCENAPLIRLDHSNMEIGALMAPRPLLLVSATGDWTRETPRVEYPAIRSIYALSGAAERVENAHIDAPHNYNQASREAMYRFFGKHLLRTEAPAGEPAFSKEPDEALRVFPGEGPVAGHADEATVLENIRAEQRRAWAALATTSPEAITPGLLSSLTGAVPVAANALRMTRTGIEHREDHTLERWVFGRKDAGDAIPALYYRGADGDGTPQDPVLLVHGRGKAALASPGGGPGPRVRALLAEGRSVLLIDAYLLGEHQGPLAAVKAEEGAFHDTFLRTTSAERIQDVLTALAFLRARRDTTARIALEGVEEAGLWCLFAAAIDGRLDAVDVDAHGFDPADDAAWVARCYLPGVRSIGGLDAPLRLLGGRGLVVRNAEGIAGWTPGAGV